MRKINLLDWRTELVKQNQKETGIAAGIAVALGLGAWLLAKGYFANQISFQENKNAYIQSEIKILEVQIKEVEALEETKAKLISRMNIIDELQKSRPEEVRLFDDMVRIIPDGTYFKTAKQNGKNIVFNGVTESSTRVSSMMRNIDKVETLSSANLVGRGITTELQGRRRVSNFDLSATQVPSKAAQKGDEK